MFTIQGKRVTIAADEKKAVFTFTLAGGGVWTMSGRPYVELTDGSVYYLDEAAVQACERKTGTWHGIGADYTLACGLVLHTLVYIEETRDDIYLLTVWKGMPEGRYSLFPSLLPWTFTVPNRVTDTLCCPGCRVR